MPTPPPYPQQHPDAVNAALPHTGLSAAEAAHRLAQDGPNMLPGTEPKFMAAILFEVVTEPMFLMLLAAGGIYLGLGDRGEALFLLSFVFLVIGITLAQERKTQRALESLRDLSAPRALVLRDGQEQRIAGRDVVRGDLLVLHEGDRIAADALLCDGHLEVDESLLTGEAVPVGKLPGKDAAQQLSASTVVTRGVGVAEVSATGAHTAVGRIGADLAATTEPPSALQMRSRALVRRLGAAALLLACAQVLLGWWWNGRTLLESLLSGKMAMAILPEEIRLACCTRLGAPARPQRGVLHTGARRGVGDICQPRPGPPSLAQRVRTQPLAVAHGGRGGRTVGKRAGSTLVAGPDGSGPA
jgi:Ca2+-transporting ATPase